MEANVRVENVSYKNTTATFERIEGHIRGGVNQVRDFSVDGVHKDKELSLSREHIDKLVEVLKDGSALDRIDVIPHPEVESKFVVIDGHHRLQAYREAHKLGHISSKSLPIKVHQGLSLKEARLIAFRANNKDKLRMSQEQKIQEAWLTLWRHWDELKGMGGIKISQWMGGVIRKSLASDMKAALKAMLEEDSYWEKQLNKDNPQVEAWKVIRRKYEHGGQAGDLEEKRLKAYVNLQSRIYRLQDTPDWKILEDDQKAQLGSLLAGMSLIDTNEDDDLADAPW